MDIEAIQRHKLAELQHARRRHQLAEQAVLDAQRDLKDVRGYLQQAQCAYERDIPIRG